MYPLIVISHDLAIPSYILIISITYCLGIVWSLFRCSARELDPNEGANLCLCIMLGGFIGARFFHILYEAPTYYLSRPMDIFRVWQGGFIFYGGAMGAFVCFWGWTKFRKLDFFKWADLFAPVFAAGYAIGRIACFLNGCCYGEVCTLPWGVHFPNLSDSPDLLRHPTQIYATLWELGVLAILMHLEFWGKRLQRADRFTCWFSHLANGKFFLLWISLHALGRLGMEFFRDDDRGSALLGLSISTWISLLILFVVSLTVKRFNFRQSE